MKTVYLVVNSYCLMAGESTSFKQEDVVAVFNDVEDAKKFAKEFDKKHVYDESEPDLKCGELLYVRKVNVYDNFEEATSNTNFWWLE